MFLAILPYFAIKEFYPSFAAPEIGSSLASLALLGLGTGLLSGLLGLSGASLVVPSLVGFFLIDHHAAQGIAMGVAVADSLAGAVTHARRGNVNYPTLVYMAPPAIIAALIGAFLSHSLSSSVLRVLFGWIYRDRLAAHADPHDRRLVSSPDNATSNWSRQRERHSPARSAGQQRPKGKWIQLCRPSITKCRE